MKEELANLILEYSKYQINLKSSVARKIMLEDIMKVIDKHTIYEPSIVNLEVMTEKINFNGVLE